MMEMVILCLLLTVAGAKKCDFKSEILEFCINIDPNYKAYSLEETQKICSESNSTSLEIYNQSYQHEIEKLLTSNESFIGQRYFLNLGYKNGTLMWLTSNLEANFTNWYEPVNYTLAKTFLLVIDNNMESYWEVLEDDDLDGASFICFENLSASFVRSNPLTSTTIEPGRFIEEQNTSFVDLNTQLQKLQLWTTPSTTTGNRFSDKSFEVRAEVALFLATTILIQPFIVIVAFLGIRYVWNPKEFVPQVLPNPSSSFQEMDLARHRYWSSGLTEVHATRNSFVANKKNSYFKKFESI